LTENQSKKANLKIKKNEWSPKKFLSIRKWGGAPFAAVFSPFGAPSGKYTIWHPGFDPLKKGQYRLSVLFLGN
jgi:hypothetical protein